MSPSFDHVDATFPGVPESVASSRRFVAVTLRRFGCDDQMTDDGVLLASELVANGLEHGNPPLRVRVRKLANGSARVEVTDSSDSWSGGVASPAPGWGHRIVDRVASRWGWLSRAPGKRVWFEIDPHTADPVQTRRGGR